MMMLILIVLVAMLSLMVVALLYRCKALTAQYAATIQKIRADYAGADVKQRRRMDTALQAIQETHREEIIHDTTPHHLAARTDLDNDWSDDSGLHSNAAAGDDHHRAAAAGSTGITGGHIERDDMLG